MNTTTNTPDYLEQLFQNTPVGDFWAACPEIARVLLIVALAFAVHVIIKLIHRSSDWIINRRHVQKNPLGFVTDTPKFITLTRLIISGVTFLIYFLAVGFVLIAVFHFKEAFLKTYLSSAAVIGLALSFGLQGLVQDVVTGVTLILSDAMDVGDIVDLSGTIGRVEEIGLRFTTVINFYNQEILVPNRNIANVARFPHGGVYAYADVQFSCKADQGKVAALIAEVARGTWAQFGAIILSEPELSGIEVTDPAGWNFIRVQFKVWPGQTLIETAFRPQIVNAMKTFDPNYADWMVQVTYRAVSSHRDKAALGEGMKK
jgi:hypothetical protein